MNKRIIASALAVTMGAGLVGSISGTVAWYQYSTRATIQMIGLSLGTEKALEIAVAANQPAADSEAWKTELKTADILAYYKTQPGNSSKSAMEFKPVTPTQAYAKDAEFGSIAFKGNPIAYQPNVNNWANAVENNDYLSFPVWVRAVEKDGENTSLVARKIGLLNAQISNKSVENKEDISSAVRVSIQSPEDSVVLAKDSASTNLYGPLALADGVHNDKDRDNAAAGKQGYYEEADNYDNNLADLVYGIEDAVGASYNLSAAADQAALYAVESAGDALVGGVDLGTTSTTATAIKLDVKVWLEGWAALGNPDANTIWDLDDYVGSQFHVGFVLDSGLTHTAA